MELAKLAAFYGGQPMFRGRVFRRKTLMNDSKLRSRSHLVRSDGPHYGGAVL